MTNWTSILRRTTSVAVLAAAMVAAPAAAAPGVPDPSFATGGVAALAFPHDAAEGFRVVTAGAGLAVVGDTATTTSRQGRIIVAGLSGSGLRDPGFGSLTGWDTAGPTVGDAIRAAGNRLVIAANGTPGNAFPERIRVIGTGAGGRPDGVFGSGGTTDIAGAGQAARLLNGPGGDILVAGERTTGGVTSGALLVRLSPDGAELGAATVPLSADATIGGAVRAADGSVLLVGADPKLFVVRFTPGGAPDTAFGPGGVRHLPIAGVQVDDARLDGAGRVLVAGAHLGDLGRSVATPVRPLLVRLTAPGAKLDGSLAPVGRGPGDVDELTSVTTSRGKILAASPDGRVLRFSAGGRPDLRFGAGGTSPRPRTRLFDAKGLSVVGPGALLTGDSLAPKGFDNRLAVERVRLTGHGLLPPRRRAFVTLRRVAGTVTVRVPVAPRDQPVGPGVTVPLLPRRLDGGDGFHFTPPGAIAGATRGTVRISGVHGAAVVRHARVTLRRAAGRVAELDVAKVACGPGRAAQIRLRGPFVVRVEGKVVRNRSATALLVIRRACGKMTRITVPHGKVKVTT